MKCSRSLPATGTSREACREGMSFNLKDLFSENSFTSRPPERKILVLPIHEQLNQESRQNEVRAVLEKAASTVAESRLLYRWDRHDGSAKLCRWDSEGQAFLFGALPDWQTYFGRHWIVKDSADREYLGPSLPVTDRLIAAILEHPSTPPADWSIQLARKREAFK
jgi:hypothetical protein